MKNNNLLKVLLGLLICFFGTYVYMNPPKTEIKSSESEIQKFKTDSADSKSSAASSMTVAEIKQMVENYKTNQLQAILSNTNIAIKEDSRAVWFDLVGLKSFINEIENNTTIKSEDLGVRFYYAAYPDFNNLKTSEVEIFNQMSQNPDFKDYGKKHTLIMVPTRKIDGNNVDYNPASENNDNSDMKIMARTVTNEIMAKNHGILVPPGKSSELNF